MATTIPLLDLLREYNEKLSLSLDEKFDASDKVKVFYDMMAESKEEAHERKQIRLTKNLEERCKRYSKLTKNDIQDQVAYLFGDDTNESEASGDRLGELYDTILRIISNNKGVVEEDDQHNKNLFLHNRKFAHMTYQRSCPVCSHMVDCFSNSSTSIIMRKLANDARCSVLTKKLKYLTFTTLHKGVSVRVKVTTPCPTCCAPPVIDSVINDDDDAIMISSIPAIDHLNDHKELLFSSPLEFVDKVVIDWVEKFYFN